MLLRCVASSALVGLTCRLAAAAAPGGATAASRDGSSPRRAIVCKSLQEAYARMEPMTKQIAPGTAIGTSSDRDESRGLEIMAVEFTTPDRNKHKVFFGYPIDRNDYLKRGWWEKRHWWDTLPDFEVRYQKNNKRILERAF